MVLALPKCAQCGNSMRRAGASADGRVVVTLAILGRPSVGWHAECARLDPLFQTWKGAREQGELLTLVREVITRGRDRVAAEAVFWRQYAA